MVNDPEGAGDVGRVHDWANFVIAAALIFVLAEITSHVFIWTYLAGDFALRNSMTGCVAISSAGGALFALLILKECLTQASCSEEKSKGARQILWAIYLLVVVLAVWAERLREGVVPWGSYLRIALVLAPLCTLLFSALCRLMLELRRRAFGFQFLAVAAGVAVGYAILGEPGTVWSTAGILAALWGTSMVTRGKPKERREVAIVWWLTLGFIVILALHVVLNTLPFGWDVAVVLALTFCSIIVVKIKARREHEILDAPTPEGATESPDGPRLPRVAVRELLAAGWIAMLFVTFAWTEAIPVRQVDRPFDDVARAPAWTTDMTWKELFAGAPGASGGGGTSRKTVRNEGSEARAVPADLFAEREADLVLFSEESFRVVAKTLGWIVLMSVTVYAFRGWVKPAKSIVERVRGGLGEAAISKNCEINRLEEGRLERRDLIAAGVGELRQERVAGVGRTRRLPAWVWWLYGCGVVVAVGLVYVFSPEESSNSKYYSCVLGHVWDDPELSRINDEIERLRRYATGLASERDPLVRAVEGSRFMGATEDLRTLQEERLNLCRRLYWSGDE